MDVFNLFAKLSLDSGEYDKGLEDSKKKAGSFGETIKNGIGIAAKAIGAATTAAAAGVAALTKNAIENYSEYEQLVGGIDTLFKRPEMSIQDYAASTGKYVEEVIEEYTRMSAASDAVMKNAAQAYKTAGVSASEYMETAIGFSGALLKSVGGDTVKAAELTDIAIKDMADQANKYGKTVEDISATYTSLARGNTQTLDNLFGGMFAGTKAGLEEMLKYAEEYRASLGQTVDYSSDSYADILAAIHDVSEATGVYGTTAREASSTIQGSLNSAKAAWKNLVTGIADENANFDQLVGDFVDSILTVGDNLLPRIEVVLKGVGRLVEGLAPIIVEALPTLIEDVLPTLLSSAVGLVGAVGSTILENLPMILETAMELVTTLAQGLAENAPEIIPSVVEVLLKIVDTLTEPENLESLLDAALTLVLELAKGLVQAIPQLVSAAFKIVKALVKYLWDNKEEIFYGAVELFNELLNAAGEIMGPLAEKVKNIVDSIKQWIVDKVSDIKDAGRQLLEGLWSGITDKVEWLKSKVTGVVDTIKGWFTGKSGFDEHSPSKWAADVFAKVLEGGEKGLASAVPSLLSDVESAVDKIKSGFEIGTQSAEFDVGSQMAYSQADYTRGGFGASVWPQAQNIEIPLILDGAVLARATYRYNQQEQQRHGGSLVYA